MDPIPAFSKSAAIGLSIMAVCKNAGKKTPGQDDFFVVGVAHVKIHYKNLLRFYLDNNMNVK